MNVTARCHDFTRSSKRSAVSKLIYNIYAPSNQLPSTPFPTQFQHNVCRVLELSNCERWEETASDDHYYRNGRRGQIDLRTTPELAPAFA